MEGEWGWQETGNGGRLEMAGDRGWQDTVNEGRVDGRRLRMTGGWD